jgi:hypothetical protein
MSNTFALESYKKAIREDTERNPFYYVANYLGVECADRTDAVIAEEMLDQIAWAWMELPRDADAQPVRWDESVHVDVCGDEVFAKVFGICENNRIAIYVPGEIPEHRFQSVNAHRVREAYGDDE